MNKVAFTGLDQQRIVLRDEIDRRIAKVIDHGQFIMGPEIREIEEALRSYCGAKHAIAVANGTDALQIALMALGVSRGDAVLVPSFTYTATAEVILILGAEPVFVDVKSDTFNLDPEDLPRALEEARRRGLNAKAIIAVDLFGLPADWDLINAFATAHNLATIDDAAQGFGAVTATGGAVGTLADITTTSFFPAKPLGCYGDGGAVFSDNDDLVSVMRSIRVHGQGNAKYETVRVGVNSRLDTIQAAILLAKISVFAHETSRRNDLADKYGAALHRHVKVPMKPEGAVSAWAQYTIRVENRDAFKTEMESEGIPTAIYYPLPMHLQPAYRDFGAGPGTLPISEQMSREVISLPMNPYWTEEDFSLVVEAVRAATSVRA